jgi:hypothetical protein
MATQTLYGELASQETPETLGQAHLRAPGDLAHRLGLPLLPALQVGAHARREAIVPCRLDQYASRVAVSGLGDFTLGALAATRVLRGHQAEKSHELARASEAREIPDLGHQRHCRDPIDTAQRHEGFDLRAHAPVLELSLHRLREALDALAGLMHCAAVFGIGDVLSGMLEADLGQIQLVCRRPGCAAGIAMPVAQQHSLQLLASLQPRSHRILASAAQVANLPLSRERGSPVLTVAAYTGQGDLQDARDWTFDEEGNWRRCTD